MRKNAVLVVIDAQNGFVTEHSLSAIPAIKDIVTRWQESGGPTVFTRYLNYPGSPYERLINWNKLQTRPETDIVDELAPYAARATAIHDKTIYSLFDADGSALVEHNGWADLYLCGIDTESCVLKTAVDAFERNLTPWVLADACASHSGPDSHQAGLLVIRKMIGPSQVITTAEVPEHIVAVAA